MINKNYYFVIKFFFVISCNKRHKNIKMYKKGAFINFYILLNKKRFLKN